MSVIHVIDDNVLIATFMCEMIEDEGFNARVYASVFEFLRDFETGDSGCVVSDLRMPGKSGIELLDALRQSAISLPVIIATGDTSDEIVTDARQHGAFDVIFKPISFSLLLAAIQRALADNIIHNPIFKEVPKNTQSTH